jgi:hypothetical protein
MKRLSLSICAVLASIAFEVVAGEAAKPFPASYSYASRPIPFTNDGASRVDENPANLKASLLPPGPKNALMLFPLCFFFRISSKSAFRANA